MTTEPALEVIGEPEPVVVVAGNSFQFNISPDGKTLVVSGTEVNTDFTTEQKSYSTIVWWQNWAQSLSKE